MQPYISLVSFQDQPSDTIVVCCSDGRTRCQIVDFLDHMKVDADLYAVPGGPLVMASGVEVFGDGSVALKRIRFLADEHNCKRILLLAHGSEDDPEAQCGMAKLMFPNVSPPERLKRQKAAVLQAAKRLATVVSIPIECWFALVVHDMVQFEPIEGPSAI